MTSRRGGRYRFFGSLFLLWVFAAIPVFADDDMASLGAEWNPLVSNIITAGVALACALFAYAGLLTLRFLLQAFKDYRASAHETHAHDEHEAGSPIASSAVFWVAALFAVVAAFTLFIALLFANVGLEMTPYKLFVQGIIGAAVGGSALAVLYLLYLTAVKLIPKREKKHEAVPAVDAVPLNPEFTRRSFLSLLGWAWVAFIAATTGALTTMLRFAFPNVTFEPPLKFKAGFPDSFNKGVDQRHKDGHRVWIVRDDTGFYALSTICTHLGCTPNWLEGEQKFKCPCHGSGYYITGVNFEGPAPRPLERFQITLADDGQIEVDENVKFQSELGQWGLPGSFLNYKA